MLLHKIIRQALGGEHIEILATDPATMRDIPNFAVIWGIRWSIKKHSMTAAIAT